MKSFSLAIAGILLMGWTQLLPQDSTHSKRVVSDLQIFVNEESEILLHGRSSINKFICECNLLKKSYTPTVYIYEEHEMIELQNAILQIDVSLFDCGIRKLTSDFKELVDAKNHPYWFIEILSLERMAGSESIEAQLDVEIGGELETLCVPVNAEQGKKVLQCSGWFDININDFNIYPSDRMLGLIKVDPMVSIQFDLNMDTSNSP